MTTRPFKIVSASQQDTFKLCKRKWWFGSRAKLPVEDRDYFHYGVALHAIAARWHQADDAGRLPDGKALELFPEGWETLHWRDAKAAWEEPPRGLTRDAVVFRYSPAEQAHIRMLVREAIEHGVWVRKPGRLIEHPLELQVGATGILAKGFADVLVVDEVAKLVEVDDHKTVKKWRYAATPAKLEKDIQTHLYAKAGLEIARAAGFEAERVVVRHNQFSKTEPTASGRFTRATEVEIEPEVIEDSWAEFVATTVDMQRIAKVQSHVDIPDPEPGACNAYGGCPFIPLCTRQVTIQKYVKRVNSANRRRLEALNAKPEITGESTMGSPLDRLRKAKNETKTENKSEPSKSINPPEPSGGGGDVDPREWAAMAAPWADPDCSVCRKTDHPGFNSLGSPCRMCTKTAEQRGVSPPGDWTCPDKFKWGEKVAPDEAPEEAQEEAQDEAPGQADETEAPETPDAKEPKKGGKKTDKKPAAGRRKKGYTLCLGCFPVKTIGIGKIESLEEVFVEVRNQLAEHKGVESFYELDPYRRKDALVVAAQGLAEEGRFDAVLLWGPTKSANNDYQAFVDALRPGADVIFGSVL